MAWQFFAIRHIPSNGWLPQLHEHKAVGSTNAEPSLDKPPRLFRSERAAKIALYCYCLGKWYNATASSGDPWGYDEAYPDVMPNTKRNKADYRVEPLFLVEDL